MNRLSGSIAAALAVAAAVAALETLWARMASPQPLNLLRAWIVAFGLLLLPALGAAVAAAGLCAMLPRASETLVAGVRRTAPVLGLAAAVWLALSAHLMLALVARDLTPLTLAALLSLATWLFARVLAGVVLTITEFRPLRAWTEARGLGVALVLGACACALPVTYGVASGTPNGEGGFWGVFGVLKRQELDLRGALLLLCLFGAGVAGNLVRGLRRPWLASGLIAGGTAALALSAVRLLDDAPLSLGIERGAAVSRASLRALRSATDGDGDGVSRWFGGHDCDDARDDVYPGAPDLAGNGLDEDCSGDDAAPATAPPPAREPAEPKPASAPPWPPDLNVVLISVDTLRYDLGYTGYPRPVSPNIDRLAERSVVFERAYALASYTGKSVGPMLIGRYPSETHRGWLHFNRFGEEETFVQERLQAAGIRTISVQGHWYFTPEYGLGRGFDVLDMSAAPAKRQLEGDKTVNSDELSDAAVAQLSDPENTRGRFFMWIHYLDPHADYIRHPAFDFGNRARDLYDSEVAFTDQQIGRVLEFIASSPLGERTAIIVTSDHGEAFGENGMWRHGFEVWEVLVRVPLVIYVPGVAPKKHHVRRSAIDLAPTLLELFNVPAPSGAKRLSGESLVDDIVMPSGHEPEPRPVFIDMSAGPYNEERQALIENDLKLIMSAGRGALGLYNLAADPAEEADLTRDKALLRTAKERFAAFQSRISYVREKRR